MGQKAMAGEGAVRWVVQTNLGNSADIDRLLAACRGQGLDPLCVEALPFADDVPDVPTDLPAIFYGSARFIANAVADGRWAPCAFFDDGTFRHSYWGPRYAGALLNADARIHELRACALDSSYRAEDVLFIRPNRDLKEFEGRLMRHRELRAWLSRIEALGEDAELRPDTEVVVASPKEIEHEWRLFMVEGRYCAGSHYRTFGRLAVEPHVPQDVRLFAEAAAAGWQPAPVFVLDIGRSGGRLGIIEVNAFNSSGFYAADVEAIVAAVTSLVAREW